MGILNFPFLGEIIDQSYIKGFFLWGDSKIIISIEDQWGRKKKKKIIKVWNIFLVAWKAQAIAGARMRGVESTHIYCGSIFELVGVIYFNKKSMKIH